MTIKFRGRLYTALNVNPKASYVKDALIDFSDNWARICNEENWTDAISKLQKWLTNQRVYPELIRTLADQDKDDFYDDGEFFEWFSVEFFDTYFDSYSEEDLDDPQTFKKNRKITEQSCDGF